MPTIVIGKWNNAKNSFPKLGTPSHLPNRDTAHDLSILDKLLSVKGKRYINYIGKKHCNICDKEVPNTAIGITSGKTNYIIYLDYIHYVKEHNVMLDPQLKDLVNKLNL